MALKLRYDAAADRMRVALRDDAGAARVFWLRRNQCLALLARMRAVSGQLGIEVLPVAPLQGAPGARPKDPQLHEAEPEPLDGIRVNVRGDRVRVVFVHGGQASALLLQAAGFERLQNVLGLQAERAGWDPAAGLKRLQAQAAARAAISRSREGPPAANHESD